MVGHRNIAPFVILVMSILSNYLHAQASVSSGGNSIQNTSGSIDVSIGIMDYNNITNQSLSISLGIQQPLVNANYPIVKYINCKEYVLKNKSNPQELTYYDNQGTMSYMGGNGKQLLDTSFLSTGVEGLILLVNGAVLSKGDSILSFRISGTPKKPGIAVFNISIAGFVCSIPMEILPLEPNVDTLFCSDYTLAPDKIQELKPFNGKLIIKYKGGNQKSISGTITTEGVTGINVNLEPITLKKDSGDLIFTLNGTPNQSGILNIPIKIGKTFCIIKVDVEKQILFIPNFFSPNGDGINDIWTIPNFNLIYPNGSLILLDRNGKIIAEFNTREVSWDGTVNGYSAISGVYWYAITPGNGEQRITGNVTLIR